MNRRLKGFVPCHSICHKFGQIKRCLIYVKINQLVRPEYTEAEFIWIERPEDDPRLAVLYREDWLHGVVIDANQPKYFPPYRASFAQWHNAQLGCGDSLPEPPQNHLFSESDEQQFKQQFAIQWLAAIEAVDYQRNCQQGWKGHRPPVEDAQYLANMAWEEWKETIGVNQRPDIRKQIAEMEITSEYNPLDHEQTK